MQSPQSGMRRANALLCAIAALTVNLALLGSMLLMFDDAASVAALDVAASRAALAAPHADPKPVHAIDAPAVAGG